jgi:hypothetical protein
VLPSAIILTSVAHEGHGKELDCSIKLKDSQGYFDVNFFNGMNKINCLESEPLFPNFLWYVCYYLKYILFIYLLGPLFIITHSRAFKQGRNHWIQNLSHYKHAIMSK